jgi:hypothetical protein
MLGDRAPEEQWSYERVSEALAHHAEILALKGDSTGSEARVSPGR